LAEVTKNLEIREAMSVEVVLLKL